MEINGCNSCTGNSHHIDIRYFFVKKDCTDKCEINFEYCLTHMMLADFFTKSKQGSLFWHFIDVIMGIQPINVLKSEVILVDNKFIKIKEHVKNPSKMVFWVRWGDFSKFIRNTVPT